MSEAATIEVRALEKRYGDNTVLSNIDLSIGAGEFLVLVGPSGCGKSTLLRCIAGLESLTDGELLIDGKLCNDVSPRDRDLAMVFQSYALYPHMTVAQNMAFSLSVRKMPKDEISRRVEEAAARLGLSDLLGRLPKELSGGQRQRVAVGRAIVRQPKGFLFDEPLSNLDASLRGHMRVELKKLHLELGATMVYVTHDQVEAMTLADRIAVLEGGDVQQVGTPEELYRRPDNKFVAGFIGSPPMNFFEAEYAGDRHSVRGEGFEFTLAEEMRAADLSGGSLDIGWRPTVFELDGEGPCEGQVEVVEMLGHESCLHLLIGGARAMAIVSAKAAAEVGIGDRVRFSIRPDDLHVFDRSSGRALRSGKAGEATG